MLAVNKWQLHLKGPQCCELGMPDLQYLQIMSELSQIVDLTSSLTWEVGNGLRPFGSAERGLCLLETSANCIPEGYSVVSWACLTCNTCTS